MMSDHFPHSFFLYHLLFSDTLIKHFIHDNSVKRFSQFKIIKEPLIHVCMSHTLVLQLKKEIKSPDFFLTHSIFNLFSLLSQN